MQLYPKQRDVLRALTPRDCAISFRSCNEGGKTKLVICAAILWHLAAYPRGHVISTSGCFRQIKDQLLTALHGYQSLFRSWKFLRTPRIETENAQCFWEGFSTNEGGKFEGHHAGGPDEPLLIIVDEAKTVKDDIFEAIERCKPTRLLIASSPGYAEGEFYRSHTTKSKFYQTFVQRAAECPHWKRSEMERIREKHGDNHPLFRSMVMAEFMESVIDAVIGLKPVEDLMADPPPEKRFVILPGAVMAMKASWLIATATSSLSKKRFGQTIWTRSARDSSPRSCGCGSNRIKSTATKAAAANSFAIGCSRWAGGSTG